jgi:hypothetical protein
MMESILPSLDFEDLVDFLAEGPQSRWSFVHFADARYFHMN